MQNCFVIEAALESNFSDTYTQGGNLPLNDLNSQEANEKAVLKSAIDCSHPVEVGIMNCVDFHELRRDNFSENGNFGFEMVTDFT